jgi:hypothetical protein
VGFAIGTLIKYITVDFPNAISSGVSWLVNRLHDGLMAVVNLFTVIIPNLVATSIEWFRGLWASVVDLTTRGISAVIDWVSKLPGRVWGFLSDMGHTIVNYFKNLVSDAVAEARKLPGLIRDAWNSLLSNATDIGKDIVRGIVNGMRSLGGWLVDQAKQLAHDAWQGAKDAIGANSPSKEFAKLGKWSVQGFAQGFDAYDLSAAIARSVKLPLTNIGPQGYQPAPAAGTPQVSVGGAQIVAYFSVDGGQFHPVVVDAMYDNAQDVALAAQQGNVDLSRRR